MRAEFSVEMRIHVTRALQADAERVAPLFDAYLQFYGAETDPAAARRFLAERIALGESVVLMAHRAGALVSTGDAVVGFAQLYPSFSSVAMKPLFILNDLYVAKSSRARGVGRRLILEAAAYAAGVGATSLVLATQRTNHRARGLYEALGFVRDAEFTHLHKALHV